MFNFEFTAVGYTSVERDSYEPGMACAIRTPQPARLRLGDGAKSSSSDSLKVVLRRQQRKTQNVPGSKGWMLAETLQQVISARMQGLLLRQPRPAPALPLFITHQRPSASLQDGKAGHNSSAPESPGILADRSIMLQPTACANTSRQRTLRTKPMSRNSPDPRTIRHEQRKQEILTQLEPVIDMRDSDASWIFLCWGRRSQCKIAAVEVTNSVDDVATWRLVRRTWYTHRGWWRQYIPLLDVKHIQVAKVSLTGPERMKKYKSGPGGCFIGRYSLVDTVAEIQQYENVITEYEPQEYPCAYNPSTGSTECYNSCISYLAGIPQCPEREFYPAKRQIQRHQMQPVLTQAFFNPILAVTNDLFGDRNLIHHHKDILSLLDEWHCPRLGELEMEALWMDDTYGPREVVLPMIASLTVLVVCVSKLVFGDWDTAWNIGCFIVALITLCWMLDNGSGRR